MRVQAFTATSCILLGQTYLILYPSTGKRKETTQAANRSTFDHSIPHKLETITHPPRL